MMRLALSGKKRKGSKKEVILLNNISGSIERGALETRYRRVFTHGNSFVVTLPKRMRVVIGIVEGSGVRLELDPEKKQICIRLAK